MANWFRRFISLRRKSGMTGTPPSARQIPADPALHARHFGERYAEPMDYLVAQRMTELGIPDKHIGYPDPDRGGQWHAFFPHEGKGGSVLGEGIGIDSGVFNGELLKSNYGQEAYELFGRSRLRDRLDAIIAHEYEEYRSGFDHPVALRAALKTDLPISAGAREIARAMERGWPR
jgi:hypothetical protein